MYNLKIITSTVRPGRKGPVIAQWVKQVAEATGNFNAEVLDLGEINLPLMNEAAHPLMKQYEHEHTKQWSAKIEEADAFVFVTAEYNYSYPAPLKNALEYLAHEWGYKASGIVSYSAGPFGGVRAVPNLKADLTVFRNVPIFDGVNIPLYNQFITDDVVFTPNEQIHAAANVMLDQLVRWTKGLQIIKEDK